MLENTVAQSVIKTVQSLNICQRCTLRFIGIKTCTSYIAKHYVQKTLEQIFDNVNKEDNNEVITEDETSNLYPDLCPSAKRHIPSPCPSCVGILQDSCEEIISKVESILNSSGHIFNDFVLQLSIPVIIDLREQLLLLYLKEKFENKYSLNLHQIPSVKDVWKWVVGSSLGETTKTNFLPNSNFQISISYTYTNLSKECLKLLEKCPEAFPNRRNKKAKGENIYNRTSVLKAIDVLSSELKDLYEIPPSPPDEICICSEIQCTHSPLYLGGRYNKYSRELSQTPWVVEGERRMESSVNELITDVVHKWILADKIIFSASGREDVDVKMLGNGRPFVLEIINPRQIDWTEEEIKDIEKDINKSTQAISVRNLQIITKKDTLLLKEGEEQKRKTYSALCLIEKILTQDDINILTSLKDTKLKQKTPIRVLHRRTLATRERLLHNIEAKIISDHHLQLKIVTQAGTYIKEFVHGDFGRTTPSLGTLLNTQADILELDVESIDLEWPPEVKR